MSDTLEELELMLCYSKSHLDEVLEGQGRNDDDHAVSDQIKAKIREK